MLIFDAIAFVGVLMVCCALDKVYYGDDEEDENEGGM